MQDSPWTLLSCIVHHWLQKSTFLVHIFDFIFFFCQKSIQIGTSERTAFLSFQQMEWLTKWPYIPVVEVCFMSANFYLKQICRQDSPLCSCRVSAKIYQNPGNSQVLPQKNPKNVGNHTFTALDLDFEVFRPPWILIKTTYLGTKFSMIKHK